VRQRPRVRQAPAGQGGRRLRGARQRLPRLRRPGAPPGGLRRPRPRGHRPAPAQVAGPAARPLERRRPGRRLPLRALRAPGRGQPHPGVRPPARGTRVLRGGHPREPRPRATRPGGPHLRAKVTKRTPGRFRTRVITEGVRPRSTSTTRAAVSSSTSRKGGRCAPRRSSTTPGTSPSASGW
jgi:hypothetical protein